MERLGHLLRYLATERASAHRVRLQVKFILNLSLTVATTLTPSTLQEQRRSQAGGQYQEGQQLHYHYHHHNHHKAQGPPHEVPNKCFISTQMIP